MKHIQFKAEYLDKLLLGIKKATIRIGRLNVSVGDELYVHCGGYVIGKIRVKNVIYKKISELTDDDAKKDGFINLRQLLNHLKKHYPKISYNSTVTILEFEWVEIFENKILSEEFAYKGMDVKEIVKTALEKYPEKFNEREKFLLKLVLEEGSIRKAAQRLGSLSKRKTIRKVIRKAFEIISSNEYLS